MPSTADKPSESERHKTRLFVLVDAEPSTQSSKDVQSSATAELGATGKSAEQKAVAPPPMSLQRVGGYWEKLKSQRKSGGFLLLMWVLMFHAQT